jgi:hypothetical protein
VPFYAHTLELPYLTGRADYPLPDPAVGGATAWFSPLYSQVRRALPPGTGHPCSSGARNASPAQ